MCLLPSINDFIAENSDKSWMIDMKNCPQDAKWHKEGDVWTHTMMVIKELNELDDWSALDKNDKRILEYAAILHDIGKPLCTTTDSDGNIISRGHSIKGELYARQILLKHEFDFNFREKVCSLIRFHSRPPNCFRNNTPDNDVISCSWLTNNKLLYLMAVADIKGREGTGKAEAIEWVHEWKILCKEHNCYVKPFPFKSDHARLLFYKNKLSDLAYQPFEDFKKNVIMLSGLPGSGKSSWAEMNTSDLPIISLDKIRRKLNISPVDNQGKVISEATQQCRELLRANQSFVFDATNITKTTRKRWLQLFFDYNAHITINYFEPKWKSILAQNKQRHDIVPENVIDKLANKLQPPDLSECHELNYFCDN